MTACQLPTVSHLTPAEQDALIAAARATEARVRGTPFSKLSPRDQLAILNGGLVQLGRYYDRNQPWPT